MTRAEILKVCPNASEDFIRKNIESSWREPVESFDAVLAMAADESKSHFTGSGQDTGCQGCPECVRVCVTIVQLRRRLLDYHDNLRHACKPLVDAIAERFGLADNSDVFRWQYGQQLTSGEEFTLVNIERKQFESHGSNRPRKTAGVHH